MPNLDLMLKALRLAWLPRLLNPTKQNWKSIPDHFFRKLGGLNFLLRCNYDPRYLDPKLPIFLQENGQFLTYEEFQRKCSCKTNFLNFYQVLSAIPKYLLFKARNLDDILKSVYLEKSPLFQLLNGHELNLDKVKTKEFYWILNEQNPTPLPTANTELNEWQTFFKSGRKICKENKLREFQFKFLHRVVVTKKELFRFGIKQDNDCLFCGEEDSIDHTFINCQFTKSFRESVFRWFNSKNNSNLLPSLKESLFGLSENLPNNSRLSAKLNYTLLFMRCYTYSCKFHNQALTLSPYKGIDAVKIRLRMFLFLFFLVVAKGNV